MSAWKSFALPKPPGALTSAANVFGTVSGVLTQGLEVVQAALQVLEKLDLGALDPAQAVIDTALGAVEKGLKDLLQDTGVYVLFVPVRRKVLIAPALQEALANLGLKDLPGMRQASTLLGVNTDGWPADQVAYLNEVANSNGGNAGFIRTVAESLQDSGDPNRPRDDESYYVTGFYVVAGAPEYLKLKSFVSLLNFCLCVNHPFVSPDLPGEPVPQNLSVSSSAEGAYITWEPAPSAFEVPTLGFTAQLNRVAILRSQDVSFMSKITVEEVFGTRDIQVGMKTGTGQSAVQVIDILDYDPLVTMYTDTSAQPGQVYYYAVAYSYRSNEADMGFSTLSNATKVYLDTGAQRHSQGAPPDWVRTPSVLSLIPSLAGLVDQFSSLSNSVKKVTAYGQYLKFIGQEVKRYEELTTNIQGVVKLLGKLAAFDQTVSTGINFYAGKGGPSYLIRHLTEALSPSNPDPNRPAFDEGDEYVMGAVVYAAAPSEDELRQTRQALSMFFDAAQSDVHAIMSSVDDLIEIFNEAEVTFSVDFEANDSGVGAPDGNTLSPDVGDAGLDGTHASALSTETGTTSTLNALLEPSNDISGCEPIIETSVVFGDDLSPTPV